MWCVYVADARWRSGSRAWYVGTTRNLDSRMEQHRQGPEQGGALWLRGAFQVDVFEARCFKNKHDALTFEESRTANLMYQHGPHRVRGGSVTSSVLPPWSSLVPWLSHFVDLRHEEVEERLDYFATLESNKLPEPNVFGPPSWPAASRHPLEGDELWDFALENSKKRRCSLETWVRDPGHRDDLLNYLTQREASTANKPLVWYGRPCEIVNFLVTLDKYDPLISELDLEVQEARERAQRSPLEDHRASRGLDEAYIAKRRRVSF